MGNPVVITLGAVLAMVLALVAVRELAAVGRSRRQMVASAAGLVDASQEPLLARADRRLARSARGRAFARELELAGITQRPSVVLLGGVVIAVAAFYALWTLLAPALGLAGLAAGFLAVRWYIGRGKERRREAFIAQLPEFARVLANATNAGLSLPTALSVAADELAEPASTELRRVSNDLQFGADLRRALDELRSRIGSREVSVLISTLVVSSRAGGSLVTSLRGIADTLEMRRETRREVRTTLTQSIATSYMVIGIGFVLLLGLNVMYPGVVEEMTRNIIGQVALGIVFVLFGTGFVVIRKMARIEP
ncbi:type II secretion system F family protein [Kribbia dieselivorans]|uniref:type II secretion system F family protein n=1 Tax=Kribbia dieselivorans TaxID=331526 RepID=UPI00083896A6|nr:type II secretion system F family protein [Kribbia dieselivorans]